MSSVSCDSNETHNKAHSNTTQQDDDDAKQTHADTLVKDDLIVRVAANLDRVSRLKHQRRLEQRCPMMIFKQMLPLYDITTVQKHVDQIDKWLSDSLFIAPEILSLSCWVKLTDIVTSMDSELTPKNRVIARAIFNGTTDTSKYPHPQSTTPSSPL